MSKESELSLRLQDAKQAIKEIKAGNASGFVLPLYGRALVEKGFELLGKFITLWSPIMAIILLVIVIVVCFSCMGGFMKSELETDLNELWIETGGRLEREIDYTEAHFDEDFANTQEVILQLVHSDNFTASLYDHLQILRAATQFNLTIGDE